MPYVITTKRPGRHRVIDPPVLEPVSRRAVATLENAWPYLEGFISALVPWPSDPDASHKAAAWIRSVCNDEGFTPLTLPDGTVIEVERVSAVDLKRAVHAEPNWSPEQIIDAYNAREARA